MLIESITRKVLVEKSPLRIKIISSLERAWYKDKKGEIFDVEKCNYMEEQISEDSADKVWVVTKRNEYKYYFLLKTDCKILSGI